MLRFIRYDTGHSSLHIAQYEHEKVYVIIGMFRDGFANLCHNFEYTRSAFEEWFVAPCLLPSIYKIFYFGS